MMFIFDYKSFWPPEKGLCAERLRVKGSVAEWSKALALGASPKGRGFEPHHYQTFYY